MSRIDDILVRSDPETAFLVLLCRVFLGTATIQDAAEYLKTYQPDLDQSYALARRHRIRPVIFSAINGNEILSGTNFYAKIEGDTKKIQMAGLGHVSGLFSILDLTRQEGIEVLPYRGPIFSHMYYGNWVLRESSDLDFLIDRKDIDKLIFLKNQGFKAKHEYKDYRDKDLHQNCMSIDLNNDTPLKRNLHLEFHYNILTASYGIRSGFQEASADCRNYLTNGKTITVLSNEASAGIVLAHHGLQDIWGGLKYYLDLAVLARTGDETDWRQVRAFCMKHGFLKISQAAFHNMELITGIPVPAVFRSSPNNYSAKILDIGLQPQRFETKGFYKLFLRLQGRDTLGWKLKMSSRLVGMFIKPSTDDFDWKYFRPSLYGLYYVCKPFRLAKKYILNPLLGKKILFPFR